MRVRRLGANGPLVSAIGYGATLLSSDKYVQVDDDEAIETIIEGLDLGLNFIDTSGNSSNDRNEVLVGRAIAGRRDEVVLATKCGHVPAPGRSCGGNATAHLPGSLDASLRRLGVEYVDLCYLERPDPQVPVEEVVGAMSRLVEAGKVRYLGMCDAGPDELRRACEVQPLVAARQHYSIFHRTPGAGVLKLLRELGIALVAHGSLGQGLLAAAPGHRDLAEVAVLSGNGNGSDADIGSERGSGRGIPPPVPSALLRRVQEMALSLGVFPAQLALAWLLHQGDDIVPIPGTARIANLRRNLAAAYLALDDHTLSYLDSAQL